MRQRIVGEWRCSIGHIGRPVEDLDRRVRLIDLLTGVRARRVVIVVPVKLGHDRVLAHLGAQHLHICGRSRAPVVGDRVDIQRRRLRRYARHRRRQAVRQRIVGERRCSIGHIGRPVEDLDRRICLIDGSSNSNWSNVVVRYYRLSSRVFYHRNRSKRTVTCHCTSIRIVKLLCVRRCVASEQGAMCKGWYTCRTLCSIVSLDGSRN